MKLSSWAETAKILARLFIQIIKPASRKKEKTNILDLSPIISAKNLALIQGIEITNFSENQLTLRLQTKEPLVDNWLWLLKVRITRGMVFNSTFCNVVEIKENNKDSCLLVLKPNGKEKLPFNQKYKKWYKKRGNLGELRRIKITLIAPEFNVRSKNFLLLLDDK